MNTTSMKKAAALSVGAAMLVTGLGLQPANADESTANTGTQSSVMVAAATSTDITQIGSATVSKFRNGDNTQDIKATVDGKTQDGATVNYWSGAVLTVNLHATITSQLNEGDSALIYFRAKTGSKFTSFSGDVIDPVVKDANGETLYTVAWDKNVPGIRLTATEAGAKLASSEFTLQFTFKAWNDSSNTSTHNTWTIGGSTIEFDNAATPSNTISNYNGSYTYSELRGSNWFDNYLTFRSDGLINDALAGKNNTEAWKTAANRKHIAVAHVTANNAPLKNLSAEYFDEYMLKAYDATHVGALDVRSTFDRLAIRTVTVDSADQINTVEKATASLPNRGDVAVYHDTDGSWWIAANMGALTEGVKAPSNNWTDATLKALYANMKPLGLGAQVSRLRFNVTFSVNNLPQSANVEYWASTGSHGTYTVKNTIVNNETADGVKLGWIGFEPNGGTGSMDTKTGGVDSKLTLPANAFTRTGYEFTGWNTKADGSGTAYKVGDQVQYAEAGVTLFAQWKGLPATVSVNANGGTGSVAKLTGVTGQVVKTPAASGFTKTGYTLTGWNTKADGSGRAYAPNADMPLPAGDTSIYAVWTANAASITYKANNGSGTAPTTNGVTDQTVTTAVNTFTRSGYTFTGWNTRADGTGTAYAAGASLKLPAGGLTLFAQWKANAASITYDGNKGTGTVAATTGVTDQNVKVAANAFTRAGYTFTGWNTRADGTGTAYAVNADLKLSAGGLTLFAQWKANAASITYDGNTGTGTVAATTGVTDQMVKTAANAFTKAGYTFTGWNTRADGTGTAYAANADLKLPAGGVKLFAQWKANKATISYIGNNGTGTMPDTNGVTGDNVTIAANAFTRAGYTFTGWNSKADGSGTAYAVGASLKLPANGITLYAQWKANAASITYDGNTGTGTTAATNGVTDQTVKVAANAFTKTGYTFTGWNTKKDGSGVAYAAGVDLKLPAGGLTLYAQWKANAASVTYQPNHTGVTGSTVATDGVTGQSVTIAGSGYQLNGYTFIGWNTQADGKGTMYQPGVKYTLPAGGVKLFAQWKANAATLSYDANGGTGTTASYTGVTDGQASVAVNKFARAGYTFTGWNTRADGTGTGYAAGASLKLPAGGVKLFAQWKADAATLSYDANGGKGVTVSTKGVTDGTVKAAVSGFTRAGYTFKGWNTKANGTGIAYAAGADVKLPAGGVTLYAMWVASPSTVSFDANGGEGTVESIQTVTDQTVTLPDAGFTRAGWTFTGWNTKADGTGVGYAPSAVYKAPAGGVALYAQWSGNEASIVFNANGGSGSVSELKGKAGESVTAPDNAFTREGWKFLGWSLSKDGSGQLVKPGDRITLTGLPVTMYAIWKAEPMIVHYDFNASAVTGEIADQAFTDDQPGTVTDKVPVRTGYTFLGWNTQKDGKGVSYPTGVQIPSQPGQTVTLFAQWKADKASVSFDRNAADATGSTTALAGATDDLKKLPENGFTRDGYAFKGWNTKADGSGVSYKPGDEFTLHGDVTLYAQWAVKTPIVTALANTGASVVGAMTALLLTAGAGVALLLRRNRNGRTERKH